MKKRVLVIIFIVLIIVIFLGVYKFNHLANQDGYDGDGNKIETDNTQVQKEEVSQHKKPNKLCDWIDKSDIIIQLQLPEKYAHFQDANSSPSYSVGFEFKDAYGVTASSRRLARKQCDYRVGFNKGELMDKNMPLEIISYKTSSQKFTFQTGVTITNKEELQNLPRIIELKVVD